MQPAKWFIELKMLKYFLPLLLLLTFFAAVPAIAQDMAAAITTAVEQAEGELHDDAAEKEHADADAEKEHELPVIRLDEVPQNISGINAYLTEKWQGGRAWFSAHSYTLLLLVIGSLVSIAGALLVAFCASKITRRILRNNAGDIGTLLHNKLFTPITLLIVFLGVFASAGELIDALPTRVAAVSVRVFWTAYSFMILWGVFRGIGVVDGLLQYRAKRRNSTLNSLIISLIRKSLKVFIGVTGVMFISQNMLDFNITALLAGAGVIGLAIAFAAQNAISNFISSIIVILDRSFAVGDRITVNGVDGTVLEVGLRSTVLRALDGNLVSIPNLVMATNTITNVTRHPFTKLAFDLLLERTTTTAKIAEAMDILHELLDNRKEFSTNRQPPSIAFTEMREWALVVNVQLWFYCPPAEFAPARQEIFTQILDRFAAADIKFAFPTTTNYLAGVAAEPVVIDNNSKFKEHK